MKALAEIYITHSFLQRLESELEKSVGKTTLSHWQKKPFAPISDLNFIVLEMRNGLLFFIKFEWNLLDVAECLLDFAQMLQEICRISPNFVSEVGRENIEGEDKVCW